MSFDSELGDVTDEAVAMFGQEGGRQLAFVYGGRLIPCYEEDETVRQDLVLGGLAEATDKIVRCRKNRFPAALPTNHQSVTIDGRAWKVRSVATSHGDPEARLTLISPNRKG